jgi:hypothetical protein
VAAARPTHDPSPLTQPERARLARELAADVGAFLLDAARSIPPPWPEPDLTEDTDEPAIARKARRQRRRSVGR